MFNANPGDNHFHPEPLDNDTPVEPMQYDPDWAEGVTGTDSIDHSQYQARQMYREDNHRGMDLSVSIIVAAIILVLIAIALSAI
jgi:hypothetical protein